MIVIVAIAYTTQLYMEFSGCMDIIIGSGKMFGVHASGKFQTTVFFQKARRNSGEDGILRLVSGLKTYVFYPVSVSGIVKKWNKFGKEALWKIFNKAGHIGAVSIPGLDMQWFMAWARWSYIFYGMYYFVILLAEVAVEPFER